MPEVVVSDTSCLILLEKIEELNLLHKLYGQVTITPEIAEEFDKNLPYWVKIKSPANKIYQQILEASLDKGEASAIALAIELRNSILVIDDLKGRKYAEKVGLTITGSLGIIVQTKKSGKISSVKPYLKKIKNTDFRISDELTNTVLIDSGETQ